MFILWKMLKTNPKTEHSFCFSTGRLVNFFTIKLNLDFFLKFVYNIYRKVEIGNKKVENFPKKIEKVLKKT